MGIQSIKFSLAFMLALGVSHVQAQETTSLLTNASSEEATIDSSAPVEIVEEKYDDGRVKVRRETTLDTAGNYVNHGKWTMFSLDDKEVAAGKFANNKREGKWTRIYDWGEAALLNNPPYSMFEAPFSSTADFKAGELHGSWIITDNQGRVASEWEYSHGKLDGTARWNYPSGKPQEEIIYKQGEIDGTHRTWTEEDELIVDDTYQDGRKLASRNKLYPSGVVMWEGMFLHETNAIVKKDDWWNAEPVRYEAQGQPERHGKFTAWFESGQKKFEGVFEHEVRKGEFSWWYENTQSAVAGSFKDDKRHGGWSWWHKNGQRAIQGQYDSGTLEGKWAYWNDSGKLSRKVDYENETQPIAVHEIPDTDVPEVADRRTQTTGN